MPYSGTLLRFVLLYLFSFFFLVFLAQFGCFSMIDSSADRIFFSFILNLLWSRFRIILRVLLHIMNKKILPSYAYMFLVSNYQRCGMPLHPACKYQYCYSSLFDLYPKPLLNRWVLGVYLRNRFEMPMYMIAYTLHRLKQLITNIKNICTGKCFWLPSLLVSASF